MQPVPPHPEHIRIADYTYDLPEGRIARYPLRERDQSKLLALQSDQIVTDIYQHISRYIPEGSLVVFNQTKVVNARLIFHKPTGGKVEIFCLEPDTRYPDVQTAMQQKGIVYWQCLVGGAGKWKPGQILKLHSASGLQLFAEKIAQDGNTFLIKISWSIASSPQITFAEALHDAGIIPLPPYLNRDAEPQDAQTYQTIFAREEGSVAAPTAALHFTDRVMQSLHQKNCREQFVTLHVGAGTFIPVKSDTIAAHQMHAEWLEVSAELIRSLLEFIKHIPQNGANDKPALLAVGTTSVRTLESLYWIGVQLIRKEPLHLNGIAVSQWYPYEKETDIDPENALQALLDYLEAQGLQQLVTRTQIIIAPGYCFRIADGLITNFHQPQSTLLLLVAALIGDTWRQVYDYALAHDFRFLSYGDGCLLWNRHLKGCIPNCRPGAISRM